jgi:uncharacterized membrane protein YgcG
MALGVTVDFNANVARFIDQIDRISDDLGRFEQRAEAVSAGVKKAFEAIGITLSVAGIGAFLKAGIDDLDALNDMADRTGIAAKELAGLQLGLKLSDTTAEAFANTANKLSINISKNREEFAKLGITARDPLEAMIQFADVFASIEDPQERAVLGTQALGKAYAELAPLLLQGGAAIREQIADGQRWSGVTNEMARQAADFNDSLDAMTFRLQALKIRAVGPLLGDLNTLIDYLGDLNTEIGETNGAVDDMTESFLATGNWIKPFSGGIAEIIYLFERLGLYVDAAQKKIDALLHLDVGRLKALTGDYENAVDAANARLNATQRKIVYGAADDVLKTNQEILTTIDKIDALRERSKTDTGLAKIIDAEEKRLDGLLKKSTELNQSINPDFKFENFTPRTPKPSGISLGGGEDEPTKRVRSGLSVAESAQKKLMAALDQLNAKYGDTVAGLEKEIALHGKNGDAARMEYEVQFGALKDLDETQKIRLLNLAAEKDFIIANTEAQRKQAAEFERLTQKFDAPRQDFIGGLGDVQDALNAGIIDENRAKAEFDKLGKSYNDSFLDPAKKGTDEMSQFSIQAARNMQDAFAEFLFDPFNASTGDMVDNFATALRKMAAEAISAQIFDGLKNSFNSASSSSGDSGSGFFGSLFSGLGSLFGGGSSGGAGAVDDMMYVAKGNVFDRGEPVKFAKGGAFDAGNVIPFAKGDIFDKPMTFPMPKGKLGMMGEAGPEAIMPLTRGPDGKLGVRAIGSGGSGGGMTIIQNLYFDSSTPRDVRRATGQAARDALGMLNGASRYG